MTLLASTFQKKWSRGHKRSSTVKNCKKDRKVRIKNFIKRRQIIHQNKALNNLGQPIALSDLDQQTASSEARGQRNLCQPISSSEARGSRNLAQSIISSDARG